MDRNECCHRALHVGGIIDQVDDVAILFGLAPELDLDSRWRTDTHRHRLAVGPADRGSHQLLYRLHLVNAAELAEEAGEVEHAAAGLAGECRRPFGGAIRASIDPAYRVHVVAGDLRTGGGLHLQRIDRTGQPLPGLEVGQHFVFRGSEVNVFLRSSRLESALDTLTAEQRAQVDVSLSAALIVFAGFQFSYHVPPLLNEVGYRLLLRGTQTGGVGDDEGLVSVEGAVGEAGFQHHIEGDVPARECIEPAAIGVALPFVAAALAHRPVRDLLTRAGREREVLLAGRLHIGEQVIEARDVELRALAGIQQRNIGTRLGSRAVLLNALQEAVCLPHRRYGFLRGVPQSVVEDRQPRAGTAGHRLSRRHLRLDSGQRQIVPRAEAVMDENDGRLATGAQMFGSQCPEQRRRLAPQMIERLCPVEVLIRARRGDVASHPPGTPMPASGIQEDHALGIDFPHRIPGLLQEIGH